MSTRPDLRSLCLWFIHAADFYELNPDKAGAAEGVAEATRELHKFFHPEIDPDEDEDEARTE